MEDGIGAPKNRRIVGATSTFVTSPEKRVVSEVSVRILPFVGNSPAGDAAASAIGVRLSPRRSMSADGCRDRTTTSAREPGRFSANARTSVATCAGESAPCVSQTKPSPPRHSRLSPQAPTPARSSDGINPSGIAPLVVGAAPLSNAWDVAAWSFR